MFYKLLIVLFFSQMISCETANIVSQVEIEGNWVLKNVFLSDAIDTPCGWEAGDHEPLTLDIVKDGDSYNFSGNSAVNSYFGSFTIQSFDQTIKTGKIETGNIGMTKKAGPPELMNCENRFINQLNNATDFAIDELEQLRIGNFRDENSHPRDGGYYLIFVRSK